MKKLPIDVSTFSMMIEDNYLYVDKTEYIYRMITAGRLYFLSRPRRFGKSLLISTLKELFSGNRDLFKGLWIDSSDYQWQKHPVIHIDFGTLAKSTPERLEESLLLKLYTIASYYEIDISKYPILENRFEYLVTELAKKNKVVLLIDEYDKPILDNLSNTETAIAVRNVLKSFYDVLKGVEGNLRALFITGVTKFAKTSIFSGLNNLNDLTVNERAAALLGYTKEELEHYFNPYIEDLAQSTAVSIQKTYAAIKTHYNGYRFSKKEIYVYNPFSVLYCLNNREFSNYWIGSGTPTFLIELLKTQANEVKNIETVELSSESLGAIDIGYIHMVPLLFQAGYFTIHEYHPAQGPDENGYSTDERYILGFPNQEVHNSFEKYLMAAFVNSSAPLVESAIGHFKQSLNNNDIELFCTTLRTLFANIPHQLHLPREAYYHSLIQLLITLIGLEGHSEISTSKGSIDMVLQAKNRIYVFEFKFNKTGTYALKQIIERKYYEKYMQKNKPITLVGLSFNMKKKEFVLDWKKQEFETLKMS